jgi:asparagine synthase (glutamine-hydrolysing)
MCGIAGKYCLTGIHDADLELVRAMNLTQHHRGPDDEGIYSDTKCVLGHKRLSIIDLSHDGHQPFCSDDKRYWLTFNGEIYNYIELREELKKAGWKINTQTDIEILLKSYLHWGKDCLDRFNGMFAFSIYDSQQQTLFCARDRFGVKPFYYHYNGTSFVFSSEIKALRLIAGLKPSANIQSYFEYLCFNRTDIFDETFLNEIKRLPKGHYAEISEKGIVITQWWNPEKLLTNQQSLKPEDAIEKVHDILVSAVKLRMRSDVPVGSCLSGGLDSSIIVGIIYSHLLNAGLFKTFTAAFPGYKLDETAYIDKLREKYPFDNLRCYPDQDAAFDELDRFVYINDEPTTSPTFYSQYQVMRLARENGITVLLDGQGGDENFAGYQYFHGFNFSGLLQKKKYGALLIEITKAFFRQQDKEAFYTFIFQTVSKSRQKKLLFRTLPHINNDFLYSHIDESKIYNEFFTAKDLNTSLVRHFQYKLEHLLRMEDRNSMAFQIEARLPYLDYRLVELVLSLPGEMKIKKGENKMLQKKAAGKYSIDEIVNRKDKIGFGTPGEIWMQSDKWQKRTIENFEYLAEKYPEIFNAKAHIKNNLYDKWKINQLAIWDRLCF